MIVSLIAAMSENRVIGIDNKLPWHIPEDLKRFKAMTSGHPVVMGRKTFDSLGKPLPKRENIVITRNPNLKINGVRVVSSVEEALSPLQNSDEEVFILGGGEIYSMTIEDCDRIYLTVIHKNYQGDAFFPAIPEGKFKIVHEERHEGPIPFTFIDYHRK